MERTKKNYVLQQVREAANCQVSVGRQGRKCFFTVAIVNGNGIAACFLACGQCGDVIVKEADVPGGAADALCNCFVHPHIALGDAVVLHRPNRVEQIINIVVLQADIGDDVGAGGEHIELCAFGLTLAQVSMLYEPFTLTQTDGTVTLASLDAISSPKLTGKLNGENFTASFSYQQVQDVLHLALGLDLDKLVLKDFPASQNTVSAQTAQAAAQPAASTRMNVQAQVNIGGIEIPYLQSEGFVLSANLTDITDTLGQTNGTVNFTLKPGQITNLDHFIKESKIAKIILLPVAVVKKVAGFLKLNLFPSDESGRGTTVSFTEGAGQYTFTNGVMNLDKTIFNASLTQISASGTADFKTEQLDMKATATLLTQAAPIALKITGTFNDPKGKLDVVNTVTSVVGGLLNGAAVKSVAQTGANATSDTAKLTTDTVKTTVNTAADLVKGIGGLFKKKRTEE